MPVWILRIWDKLRASFWFVPLLMILSAVGLALLVCWIDKHVSLQENGPWGWLSVNAETARSTLSLLSGTMITLSGVVFSLTMVTLSLTSSQFGSRLLRTTMTDLTMQVSLGVFLATTLYCLVVLRFIPLDAESPFVPHLAVFLGLILSVASLVTMIVFVHHVGVSIQAQNVVAEVANELNAAIQRLFPEKVGKPHASDSGRQAVEQVELAQHADGLAVTLKALGEGYLQTIDVDNLMEFACRESLVLELLYRPGDFVIRGVPLVRVKNVKTLDPERERALASQLNAGFLFGRSRTPRQDVCCAVNELVEMAVRALSPGINDPFTAVACIDHMTAAMSRLLKRELPSPFRYDGEQQLRIIARPVEIPVVIETAFSQILDYGDKDGMVVSRLLESFMHLSEIAQRPIDRNALHRQAERLYQRLQSQENPPTGMERLKANYERICAVCQSPAS